MRKTNVFILLAALFLTTGLLSSPRSAGAQQAGPSKPQVLNDEGYGNDDAEYYNAEDDTANVADP